MRVEGHDLKWSAGGTPIVDGVSIEVAEGQMVAIVGPNGSGKSSLLSLLARTLQPASGALGLDGKPYQQWSRREMAQAMSVVQQQVHTEQDMLVREVIDLGRIPHRGRWAGSSEDQEAVERAAVQAGIDHLLDRHWHTLSGGEQQRVQIARAFAQGGRTMLLDEPTNHLDIQHQLDVLDTLRTSGLTVLVVLHDLNLALNHCDRLVVLHAGRVRCCGRPQDVLTPEVVSEVFGVEAQLLSDTCGGTVLHFRRADTTSRRVLA